MSATTKIALPQWNETDKLQWDCQRNELKA